LDGPRDRAVFRVNLVYPFYRLTIGFVRFQVIRYFYPLDHQYVVVLLDFSDGLRPEFTVACINLARFQRTSKGSGQSPCCGRYKVVQRGSMRRFVIAVDTVMIGHLRVDSEGNWIFLGW
jgi:hypothetical protein